MKTKHNSMRTIILGSGIAIAIAFGVWTHTAARADDRTENKPATPAPDPAAMAGMQAPMQMDHITKQAQAEALKPGDSMSITCSKCKDVMVQKVTAGDAHIKMMTVGEKFECPICKGMVEVVATGKGEGKDAEVKHVCSKCGDDAMFCSATKPGSGAMPGMDKDKMKGMADDKMKDMDKDKMPDAAKDKAPPAAADKMKDMPNMPK